jgi:hypothetical protein
MKFLRKFLPTQQHQVTLACSSTFMLITSLLLFRPIDDYDIFTQIRLGQLALIQGGLITTEPFSYLNTGGLLANPGWLAQILFALLYHVGSWPLLQFFNAVLFALSFYVVMRCPLSPQEEIHTRSIVIGSVIALLSSLSSSSFRPQIIGLFSFCICYRWILQANLSFKRLLALIPLCLIWQNMHPSVALASVLFLSAGIGAWLDQNRKLARHLIIASGLTFLLQLATPLGVQVFELAARNRSISHDLLAVSEWMPAWDTSVRASMLGFWLALIALVGSLITLRRNTPFRILLPTVLFVLLSLWSARFVYFLAPLMLPPLRARIGKMNDSQEERPDRTLHKIVFVLATFLSILWCVIPQHQGISRSFPLALVERLAHHFPRPIRIFNYHGYAGILELFGNEKWRIHLDGRLYLFTTEQFQEFDAFARGKIPLIELERRYHPSALFLHKNYQQGIIVQLTHSLHWIHFGEYENASVWVKSDEENF